MDYELDSMFKFRELGLNFEVHVADLDGECFIYNVYFDEKITDEKTAEVSSAIDEWSVSYGEDAYLGYISVTKEADKVTIFLDLGGADDCDESIYGIVKALNNVKGVQSVIIGE